MYKRRSCLLYLNRSYIIGFGSNKEGISEVILWKLVDAMIIVVGIKYIPG
jgi:hypothetical protein